MFWTWARFQKRRARSPTLSTLLEQPEMELSEFLAQTKGEVNDEIAERMSVSGTPYPYPIMVFSEIVMKHMEDVVRTPSVFLRR
jgi:hypothetical protein